MKKYLSYIVILLLAMLFIGKNSVVFAEQVCVYKSCPAVSCGCKDCAKGAPGKNGNCLGSNNRCLTYKTCEAKSCGVKSCTNKTEKTEEEQKIKVESADCNSLLGSTKNSSNPQPAYYLHLSFNIIKYTAVLLLIIFTMKDYFMAIVAKDDDALSKANGSFIKRLIYAIIILLLPILVDVILDWANIIDTSVSCDIGRY